MKIYIVTAEHWRIPGLGMTVHASKATALEQAVGMTRLLWDDSDSGNFIPLPTLDNWEEVVGLLRDVHGAEYVYVEITEKELLP